MFLHFITQAILNKTKIKLNKKFQIPVSKSVIDTQPLMQYMFSQLKENQI